jgi:CRISPR-associated protein (TIGR02584 family)
MKNTSKVTRKRRSPQPGGRKTPLQSSTPPTALLAVTGMSPAVLTETTWALAHPTDDRPPILPVEVVAITTLKGAEAVRDQLLTAAPGFNGQTAWQTLRRELLGTTADSDERLTLRVVVMERPDAASGLVQPLADIRTQADNLAAAEFILRQVRQHTDSTDRLLIASLAGGRKTMSALLHAAFCHLARPQDRLTHILVSEPFENPALQPRFFYCTQPCQALKGPDGRVYQARDARLELADVPFVPLRVRFPDIADIPTRFRDLVRSYCDTFKRDATKPAVIELLEDPPRVAVDGMTIELESARQLVIIRFLLQANEKQWLQKDQIEAAEIFKAWHGYPPELQRVRPALRPTLQALYDRQKSLPGDAWIHSAGTDEIKRALSFLRRKLEQAGAGWIPPKRDLRFPPFRLAGES